MITKKQQINNIDNLILQLQNTISDLQNYKNYVVDIDDTQEDKVNDHLKQLDREGTLPFSATTAEQSLFSCKLQNRTYLVCSTKVDTLLSSITINL